jgi:hypothetical protein
MEATCGVTAGRGEYFGTTNIDQANKNATDSRMAIKKFLFSMGNLYEINTA